MTHYIVTAHGVDNGEYVYRTEADTQMGASIAAYGEHGRQLRNGRRSEALGPFHTVQVDHVLEVLTRPEGGTIALDGAALPATGFFVGGIVSPLIYDEDDDPQDIEEFVKHIDDLNADYLGWWTDSEDDRLWIDATDWYESLTAALVVAKYRNEIAIYDIANQQEIRVK